MAKSKKKTALKHPKFDKNQFYTVTGDGSFDDCGSDESKQREWIIGQVSDRGGRYYLLTYTLTKVEQFGSLGEDVPVTDVTKEVL